MKNAISIFLVLLSIAFNILAILFYLQVYVAQGAYRNGASQAVLQVYSTVKDKGFVDLINGKDTLTLIPKPLSNGK